MFSRQAMFESTFWLSIYPSSFSAGRRAQQLRMLRIYAKQQVAATPAIAMKFPPLHGLHHRGRGSRQHNRLWTAMHLLCIRESVLHVAWGQNTKSSNLGRYASLSGS